MRLWVCIFALAVSGKEKGTTRFQKFPPDFYVSKRTIRNFGRVAFFFYKKLQFSGTCDLKELLMPENADKWTCNKPINQDKVGKKAICQVICLEGHDLLKGNEFSSGCPRDGAMRSFDQSQVELVTSICK